MCHFNKMGHLHISSKNWGGGGSFIDHQFLQKWRGGGAVTWPPCSPDPAPLDFFLLEFFKDSARAPPLATTLVNLPKIPAATLLKPNLLSKKCGLEYRWYIWWHRKCSHWTSVKLWTQKLQCVTYSVDFSVLLLHEQYWKHSSHLMRTPCIWHARAHMQCYNTKCMTDKCSCILLVTILKHISNRSCTASGFCMTYRCLHNLLLKIYV
jgi:hypothetical protein